MLLPAGTAICLWLLCASASAALSSAPDTAAWVPVNGNVKALTKVAGTTYVGGEFTQVGKLVGPGVVYDAESELPDSSWPTIEGIVTASASDGNGGWYVAGNLDRVGEAGVTDVVHIGANHKLDTSFIPPAPPQTGTFGQVSALAVSATAVYVGGPGYLAAFSRTGGALLWSVEVERVYTLTVSGGTIYAGGIFTSVRDGETRVARDHLAAFDAATGALSLTWHPEANEAVAALAAAGSLVYAGGAFTAVNGTTVRDHLAAFNGTTGAATAWNPQLDGSVLALAVGATAVYVGGQFTHVNGGTERNHAAAFKRETGAATAWNPNVDEAVYALAISGSQIVAGGNFQHVDGTTPRSYLASFNDTSGAPTAWNPSLEEFTTTLAASGSQVFVGGEFLCAGVKTRDDLFAYNEAGEATAWNPDVNGAVQALTASESGSTVYAGGAFTSVNQNMSNPERRHLAAFSTSGTGEALAWNPNVNGQVNALALGPAGTTIYAGGSFTEVNGTTQRVALAAFDTTTATAVSGWNPEVAGGGQTVDALALSGSALYVGGSFEFSGRRNAAAFTLASGGSAGLTSWDPSPDGGVDALLALNSNIYAGGEFEHVNTTTTTVARSHAAAFDEASGTATAWNPDIEGPVYALAAYGSEVIIGGHFYDVNGLPGETDNLIGVDELGGTFGEWSPEPGNTVYAILPDGSGGLDVGGEFLDFNPEGQHFEALHYAHFGVLQAPANGEAPTISGTPAAGDALSAEAGSWTGSRPLTYAFQWQRCNGEGVECVNVEGANGETYGLTNADAAHTIRLLETAKNRGGEASVTSAATAPVGASATEPPATTTSSSTTTTTTTTQTAAPAPRVVAGLARPSNAVVRGGRTRVTCRVTAGTLGSCTLVARARLDGRTRIVGEGSFRARPGSAESASASLTLRLNSLGIRAVSARAGGLVLRLSVMARTSDEGTLVATDSARVFESVQVVYTPRYSFGANSSTPTRALLGSLRSLAARMGPVREILCTAHIGEGGSRAQELALARARAACFVLYRAHPGARYRYTTAAQTARTARSIEATIIR